MPRPRATRRPKSPLPREPRRIWRHRWAYSQPSDTLGCCFPTRPEGWELGGGIQPLLRLGNTQCHPKVISFSENPILMRHLHPRSCIADIELAICSQCRLLLRVCQSDSVETLVLILFETCRHQNVREKSRMFWLTQAMCGNRCA